MAGPYPTPVFSRRPPPLSTPKLDATLSRGALRVYLTLADERIHADPDGWIVFSPTRLAAESCIARAMMFRGLKELAARGHIERGRRGRFTSVRIVTSSPKARDGQ